MSLDQKQAAQVKGMLRRGDRQSDIASWFGVNSGRIAEIATGDRFFHVQAACSSLPPQGPYSLPALFEEIATLRSARR